MRYRRIIHWLIKYGIPLLLVGLLYWKVDALMVIRILRAIQTGPLLGTIPVFLMIMFFQALRWEIVCRQLKMRISIGTLFEIHFISWFTGSLPLSGTAALTKVMYLKGVGVQTGKAAVSVVAEKVIDILGVILFAGFGLIYLPAGIGSSYRWILAILFILAGLLFLLGRMGGYTGAKAFLSRIVHQRLQKIAGDFESDLGCFSASLNAKVVLIYFSLTVIIGILRSAAFFLLAISLGIHISFLLALSVRSIVGVVNMIPVSVSGLGTRDAVLIAVLPYFGVSMEAVLSLGLVAFLWTVASKLTGVVFWLHRPLPVISKQGMPSENVLEKEKIG